MSLTQGPIELRARWLRRGPHRGIANTTSRLRIATMNVWFGEHYQRLRWEAIFKSLQASDVDIVAFQEVTSSFVRLLARQGWTAGYQWIDDGGVAGGGYGAAILSRVAVDRAYRIDLPSEMGRCLLAVEVLDEGQPFTFATTHLESYQKNADYRAAQLQRIQDALLGAPQGILCGDLNFCASWQLENDRLSPRFTDLWSSLRPSEPGYTVDTQGNRMLAGKEKPPVRFDRLLLFSENARWRGETIELLGNQALPGLPTVYPSDHYGLLASIAR